MSKSLAPWGSVKRVRLHWWSRPLYVATCSTCPLKTTSVHYGLAAASVLMHSCPGSAS